MSSASSSDGSRRLTVEQIVELVLKGLGGAQEEALCREYGVSLETYGRWREIFLERGASGLRQEEQGGAALPQGGQVSFNLLIESIPHAVFAKDLKGRFIYGNSTYCKIQGVRPQDLVGKDDFFIHPPEMADKYRSDDARVVQTGQVFTAIEENVQEGRDSLWTEVVKAPIHDATGAISGVIGMFWDITEQYAVKEALSKSEANLRRLIDHAPLPICAIGENGDVLSVNKAFDDLFGHSEGNVPTLRDLLATLFPDETRGDVRTREAISALLERIAWVGQECRFTDKTGKTRHIQITSSELNDRFVLMMTDVTRLKEAEHSLKEREEHYRTIFENFIDAYYRADMSGKLILASPSTARMLGYGSADDVIGKDIAETFWVTPEDREAFVAELQEKGAASNFLAALKCRTGGVFTAEINARTVYSHDGAPLFIEGSFRDVTARVEAEEKLRVSELFYRSLFENTGAATVLFEDDAVIQKCNGMFERLAGLPQEEIEGKFRWTDFVDAEDLRRMREFHEQRVIAGYDPPREYDFTFLSHGGRKHFIHVTVNIIEGSRTRIASLVDITPRKRAEEELAKLNAGLEGLVEERTRALTDKASELEEANARLLELDKMKSMLVSTVSHELRTPLTSLLGFAKLLQKHFIRYFSPLSESDPKLKERARVMRGNLEVMEREGARLARLINDLLDLARIESNNTRWNDERLDAGEIVADAVSVAAGEFRNNPHVALRLETVPGDLTVEADRDRLMQVLLNLLNNAAKFTRKGEVAVTVEGVEDRVEIRVRDTGEGIPEDQLDSIFESFHTHRKGDAVANATGAGLGLTISRQIVERYGGSIRVSSKPGEGSEFTVILPRRRPG